MKKRIILLSSLFLLIYQFLICQQIRTIDEAIQIGLENNYNIRIARNSEAIAANQNTKGNAGFLPRVSVNGGANYSTSNSNQKFFSGQEQIRKGAGNTSVRSGVAINWTAFDGFKMYAVKEQLELLQEKSQDVTRQAMHDLVYRIGQGYSDLLRIQERIDNTSSSIELNQALLDLASAKLGLGATTKLEVLQSTNRVNADSAQLMNLENQFALAKVSFNRLLRVPSTEDFSLASNNEVTLLPSFTEALQQALQQNYAVQLLTLDEQIALSQIKEARSQLYPTLDLNAGFNYNWSKSEAGFLLSNRTFGPTIGITANYNIFTGRDLKKDIANVELFQENIQLQKLALEADIENDLASFYQEYAALETLKNLEQGNLRTAQDNTSFAQELYRAGRATNFEVREAIQLETDVKDRLSDISYRQELLKIEISYLSGILLMGIEE